VANELVRILQDLVHQRGLPLDYMHRCHEILVSGFRTWLTSRWLKGAILEVWEPTSNQLVERYDLELDYQPPRSGGAERFETRIKEVAAALSRLPQKHPNREYRVIADLNPGAPMLPGWEETNLRDTSHLQRQEGGNVIDTARIGVAFHFWS